ncbi:MAG: hypothetical protein JNK60_14125, partial [Acidobacteria bacterium]|nr:hypothetical protein [Acidobacteriota bacterium]
MNRETVMTPFLRSTVASLAIVLCAAAPEARAQQDPFALTPTLTGQAVFSCNDLMVNGNTDSAGPAGSATNQGHVLTNGKITVNSNAKVDGTATAGPGKPTPAPNGNGQITGTRSVASATTPCTPINLTTLTTTLQAQNDNSRVPSGYLNGTQLTVNGGTLTLPAGTYYFTQLTLNGSAQLAVSGLVKILLNDNNLNLGGGVNAGTSADPALLRLYTTSSNLNFN